MKTLTLNQTNTIRRILLLLLLAAAFSILFVFAAKPVHAHSVSGEYAVDIEGITVDEDGDTIQSLPADLEPSKFSLYRVGSFARDESGKSYLTFDEAYQNITDLDPGMINIDHGNYSDDVLWTKDWLASALAVYNNLVPSTLVGSAQSESADGNFKFTINADSGKTIDNGLYLLVGESQEITYKGKKAYWWPQPMLVLILNKDAKVGVKPLIKSLSELTVRKVWDYGKYDAEIIKKLLPEPESVDIKIFYEKEKGTRNPDKDLYKTITLPMIKDGEKVWAYTWKTPMDKNDPSRWYVQEVFEAGSVLANNYSASYSMTFVDPDSSEETQADGDAFFDGAELITITNKYRCHKLKLTKNMAQGFVNNGDNLSTTIIFEITSKEKDSAGKPLYHKVAGMEYNPKSGANQDIYVDYIPWNITEVTVVEKYTANYTPVTSSYNVTFSNTSEGTADGPQAEDNPQAGDDSPDADVDGTAGFVNNLKNNTHLSGIINKFSIVDGSFQYKKR